MKGISTRFTNTWFLLVAVAVGLGYMFVIDNTYDTGDSLEHYEISRYSWKHSYLFFDNWGKPVFTFLSSPFTQFGWIGMKLFNTLTGIMTCFALAKIIQKLIPSVSPYWALMLFCVPNWVLSLNSGLTEPLFACFLVSAVYFIVTDKPYLSALLISFLPMVRNEGYIIMFVYACYFALKTDWKSIALLSAGTLIISVSGYMLLENNNDPLWIFHTTPYLSQFVKYSHGGWEHYFIAYYYMTGIPVTILTILSVVYFLYKKMRLGSVFKHPDVMLWLVFGVFIVYFTAHVVFWKFGLFNSFGMNRVLLSVIPLMILPIVLFIAQIQVYVSAKIHTIISVVLIGILVMFPYSGNKSGFILPQDFKQQADLQLFQRVVQELKQRDLKYDRLYVSAPGFIWSLGADQFSPVFKKMYAFENESDYSNSVIVYDNWYSNFEHNVSENTIVEKIGKDKLLYTDQSEKGTIVKVYYVPAYQIK
ncbi:MAG: hypothetical protein H7259_04600 [Cytophagales bacterium]|nr:hypothetical protein [Cytophaga sp.]